MSLFQVVSISKNELLVLKFGLEFLVPDLGHLQQVLAGFKFILTVLEAFTGLLEFILTGIDLVLAGLELPFQGLLDLKEVSQICKNLNVQEFGVHNNTN